MIQISPGNNLNKIIIVQTYLRTYYVIFGSSIGSIKKMVYS